MQYRPPNAYQEVSNTNHFGSVSDGGRESMEGRNMFIRQYDTIRG